MREAPTPFRIATFTFATPLGSLAVPQMPVIAPATQRPNQPIPL
jgi:hypothetical protein